MTSLTHDLAIRGGTVVDGTGAPSRRCDVGVKDGVIVAVGDLDESATETLDASGCIVAPGFIDPHTHFDAQLCWDPAATPSSLHGVTSIVIGLCGFGVAPCPEGGGDYLLRSLEMVEEIPFASTSLGVQFEWGTWAEYRSFLATQPLAVNVAGFVPHSALRYHVMGERARGEVARPDERMEMASELRRSLAAGAIGLATSRGPNHNDAYGDPVPSRHADDDELIALVAQCAGRVWQINVRTKFSGDAAALIAEVDSYAAWSADAGARLSWTPFHADPGADAWRDVLDHMHALNRRGVCVVPQVAVQPVTVIFRFDEFSYVVFVPGWTEALTGFFDLEPAARLERLGDPTVRAAMRAAPEDAARMFAPAYRDWVVLASSSRPDMVGRSVGDAAADARMHAADLLCDLVIADRLGTIVQVPVVNRSREGVAALIGDDDTLIGLGDAGAHVTSVRNYTYPTDLLAQWVRDDGVLTLERAVHRLTGQVAAFLGLGDRGVLVPGRAADVTVFDLEHLALGPLTYRHDLPGGAPRLFQPADGYVATVVNGRVAVADGTHTGAGSGQLLSPQ
jgi:N-acyl-D-aspartate/D-glutamate deacylase